MSIDTHEDVSSDQSPVEIDSIPWAKLCKKLDGHKGRAANLFGKSASNGSIYPVFLPRPA